MKRTLNLILAAAMCMALFSGCSEENVSEDIPDISSDISSESIADNSSIAPPVDDQSDAETDSNAETEPFGKDGDITGYGYKFNLYTENEDGTLTSAAATSKIQPFNINEGLDLVVELFPASEEECVGADLAEAGFFEENGIKTDIYVFCNGQVIKHSLDPNEEAAEKTTVTVTANKQNKTHIYIPPTELGNVENALLWVCADQLPEYIPESPRGELPMTAVWAAAITSSAGESVPSVYEAQENDYIYGEQPTASSDPTGANEGEEKIYTADIGKYNERCHSSSKKTMDEVAVIDKDTDFAITAYFENDFDYYLAVFCDGELINAFDGKPLMKANCQGGERMIKYSLDKESLPENGYHSYSVIALPEMSVELFDGEDVYDATSNRRLVQIDI